MNIWVIICVYVVIGIFPFSFITFIKQLKYYDDAELVDEWVMVMTLLFVAFTSILWSVCTWPLCFVFDVIPAISTKAYHFIQDAFSFYKTKMLNKEYLKIINELNYRNVEIIHMVRDVSRKLDSVKSSIDEPVLSIFNESVERLMKVDVYLHNNLIDFKRFHHRENNYKKSLEKSRGEHCINKGSDHKETPE